MEQYSKNISGGEKQRIILARGLLKQANIIILDEALSEVDFVLETVNQLLEKHGHTLSSDTLLHSDQGCHYTSISFRELLVNASLRQSMSRRGNCWDNAPQESFFGHMKEEIRFSSYKDLSYDDVKSMIDDWINYYNNERYQMGLQKLSPNEFYNYITTGEYPISMIDMGIIPNEIPPCP